MTFDLLDINVWLALHIPAHRHQTAAKHWFTSKGEAQCMLCRVTQMGLLRHFTNKAVMGESVLTIEQAWSTLRNTRNVNRVGWLEEPATIEGRWEILSKPGTHRGSWWTDAYLAAFAIGHDIRLVTFDRDFQRFERDGLNLLLLSTEEVPQDS